jgi:hypothetical protein
MGVIGVEQIFIGACLIKTGFASQIGMSFIT